MVPETIQALAPDVVAHRLVLEADAAYAGRSGRDVVAEVIETLEVPV